MKNLIRLELKKALHNPFFWVAIGIGTIAVIMGFVQTVHSYQEEMKVLQAIMQNYEDEINPGFPAYLLINHWIGGERWSLGSSIYFFIFPLLVAIPYGWSYCLEKQTGYLRNMVVRAGRTPYYLSKYLAVFVSGGLTMVIPMLLSVLLTAMVFPAVAPNVLYDTNYGVSRGDILSMFYYAQPFLYILFYLLIDFVFCGLIACMAFAAASWVKYRAIVMILPFFCFLVLDYAKTPLFYTNPTQNRYHELSLMAFVRPMPSLLPASWPIIIAWFVALLLLTLSIVMLWEKNREIY